MFTGEFFFLRPEWLLLIVVWVMLLIFVLRRTGSADNSIWSEVIDAHLLNHLVIEQQNSSRPKVLLVALFLSLLACIIAMAGPTWEKNERPAFKSSEPVVLVMSLAQSMNTEDVSPNRLARASHKTIDILNSLKGNDIGLVIYSDRPFTASPLTSDTQLIKEMLPELSPNLMPILGNRLDLAIDQASRLLLQTGAQDGQIIVMTSSAGELPVKSAQSAKKAADAGFKVNVLGIGTAQGGELITASGRSIVDEHNQVIVSKLESSELKNIASAGSGQFTNLSADNSDIDLFINSKPKSVQNTSKSNDGMSYDDWQDMGFWLLLIPVLLAPLAFQRGLLMSIPLCFVFTSLIHTSEAEAFVWKDLWHTQDQQAQHHYATKDYSQAAQMFQNEHWKASALYKAGRYKEAVSHYGNSKNSKYDFNLGNALAHSGELEKAISAYDLVLEKNPDDEDARFNRDLVAKLLQQQQEQTHSNEESPADNKAEEQSAENDQKRSSSNASQENSGNKQQNQANNMDGQQNPQDQNADHPSQSSEQDSSNEESQSEEPESRQSQSGSSEQQADQNQTKTGSESQNSNNDTSQSNDQSNTQASTEPEADNSKAKRSNDKPVSKNTTDKSSPESMHTTEQSAEADINDTQDENEAVSSNIDKAKDLLDKTMDKLLKGNENQSDADKEHADTGQTPSAQGEPLAKLNQTAEQMLRTVPDHSSGLLKARIRQHYRRLMDVN